VSPTDNTGEIPSGEHLTTGATPARDPIRVLLVDDHRLIPESLAHVLGREPDMRVVGIAATVAETRTAAKEPVDVVLLDYRLPDGTGVDAIGIIRSRWPNARIVMLTAVDDDEIVLESIQAGADGYLTKDRAVDDVVATVRAAHMGAPLLPRSVTVAIAKRVAEARDRQSDDLPVEPLTPRELEVLRALVDGLSTPQIAERMHITPNTLRTHVQNIMSKLHVHSKLEAVALALRLRLVEPPRRG
jgi:DNA-binding NarL/FixJ family response regulator